MAMISHKIVARHAKLFQLRLERLMIIAAEGGAAIELDELLADVRQSLISIESSIESLLEDACGKHD